MTIRDRIQDFRRVPARELLDNEGNPRTHPQIQRDALRGLLEQVGIAGALIAYHSERNGGKLTLVDGHLRKQDYDLDWPTLILDVNDAEADLLLAAFDPLAALAAYERAKLDALLKDLSISSGALEMLLGSLRKDAEGQEGSGAAASSAGDCEYPITPVFGERYAYVIVFTTNETDFAWVQTKLELAKEQSYKNSMTRSGQVVPFEKFKRLWESR